MILPVSFEKVLAAPNAAALLEEYAAECALPELGPIAPQPELYRKMEDTGAFQCFAVYDEGMLAGFATALSYVVPHYGRRIATVESLFLAKAHRLGRTGNSLMLALENWAAARGCAAILYSAPAGSQLEKLLRLTKGYRHSNTVFLRSL